MTTQEVFEKLDKIFQDEFDDESIHVTKETTANDIEDWDSLAHINLISAIETEFGMEFTMGEVTGMKNVGEMAEIIMSRVN
ncbi:MAG: acyl carrier protein [Clostridiales bacterium]|nr:acyl carrier protein [Clostridiales bacterium]